MINGLKEKYYKNPTILILGSLPSKISIEKNEYYGNPKNQFWKIISNVFEGETIEFKSYKDKEKFLEKHHIALWDVIKSADRKGSLDINIKKEKYNDLYKLITKFNINRIYVNGKKAESALKKYLKQNNIKDIHYTLLTSSSSANTRYTLNEKISNWKKMLLENK